jgi:lipoate-protein ligase A
LTPAENVARDEELLQRTDPVVRVAVLTERAVCLGVGQRGTIRAAERAAVEGVPIVRRQSGGTGLLNEPGDLAWALVLPRDHPMVGRDFVHGFGRLGAGAAELLQSRGLGASWDPSEGEQPEFCVLGPQGSVLVVQRRVLGGAAQHLAGPRLLHHGVLQGRLDPRALQRFFGLSPELVRSRLTDLAALGVDDPPEKVGRALLAALADSVARPLR